MVEGEDGGWFVCWRVKMSGGGGGGGGLVCGMEYCGNGKKNCGVKKSLMVEYEFVMGLCGSHSKIIKKYC